MSHLRQSSTFSDVADEILSSCDGSVESTYPGMRRIRLAALTDSSDELAWSQTIELPENQTSIVALQFIGLKYKIAHELYERHITLSSEYSEFHAKDEGLRGLVKEHIVAFEEDVMAEADDDVWDDVLKRMGIKRSTREGILDPEYSSIRYTKSAKEWSLETLDLGWELMDGADSRVKANKDKVKEAMAPRGAYTRHKQRSETGIESSEPSMPSIATTATHDAPMPECVLLHKGGAHQRFLHAMDSKPFDPLNLASVPPTDFHREATHYLYFTKSMDCARKYAGFTHARQPSAIASVISVAVPRELLLDAVDIVGDDWKELLWWSQGKTSIQNFKLPQHLEYYTKASILVGKLCAQGNAQIQALEDKHCIQSLRLPSGDAPSQHVFQSFNIIEELSKLATTHWSIQTINFPVKEASGNKKE